MKVVFNILKLSIFFILIVFLINKQLKAESYQQFSKEVEDDFNNKTKQEKIIGKMKDGSEFSFTDTLISNYENFANNRYKANDFIDAYYFKTKAMKIKNYKIISPANPYSFGIIPDDIEQFVMAREQLRSVSINSIINSNDGLVLADSYIAYDCWLEAFEEGNVPDRVERCRNRFLDNMKAMRISLLMQGYNVFDMTTRENLALNNRLSSCETCVLYKKGQYCNTLYFETNEAKLINKMNLVIKRIQRKISFFSSPTISMIYYNNTSGYNKKLSNLRLNALKNLLYNSITIDYPIKPIIKIVPIGLKKNLIDKKIYRDAVTICVSGNE